MKALSGGLAVVGLILLAVGIIGKAIGDPGHFFGHKAMSIIILANSALLLAIIAKLCCCEKK